MSNKTFLDLVDNEHSVRLDRILSKLEGCFKLERELSLLKHNIASNTLNAELYEFLDDDDSLKTVLKGIPYKDTSTMSQEAVDEYNLIRMKCVDEAMESVISKINAFIISLWHAFLDWLDDWFDTNKRLNFRLKQRERHVVEKPMAYGSDEQFNNAVGYCFIYNTEWKVMLNAVTQLSALLETVSANNPEGWLERNHSKLVQGLAEFGYEVTDTTVRYDNPKYVRIERKIGVGGGGWSKSIYTTNLGVARNMLDTERSSRTAFLAIRRTFDKVSRAEASDSDKIAMVKLVKACKAVKMGAALLARAIYDIGSIALRNVGSSI